MIIDNDNHAFGFEFVYDTLEIYENCVFFIHTDHKRNCILQKISIVYCLYYKMFSITQS